MLTSAVVLACIEKYHLQSGVTQYEDELPNRSYKQLTQAEQKLYTRPRLWYKSVPVPLDKRCSL